MGENLMRIGEIAAFFDVSVKALRVYERLGILTPETVDGQTGYRYYAADQVRELDALLDLKRLGFSLLEIKELLEGGLTKDQYMEALVHKKAAWQDTIADARDKMNDIDDHIAALKAEKPLVKMHELTEDERARLLGRLICVKDKHAKSILGEALWL